MAFWKLIRYPNLLIVALTQFLFYWFIQQVFHKNGIEPILDLPHFSLLVLTTIIIAASGYIINDIYDLEIDLINKSDRMIIGKSISIARARFLYNAVVVFGALIAIYLAFYVNNLQLFLIYPIAVFIMWFYSKSLKKKPLSGNIVVALFSAFVAGIVWFAERAGFAELHSEYGIQMKSLFLFYMLFAFSSTLYREVIKDIEDFKGDIDNNCRTLPIVLGIRQARKVTLILGLFLLGCITYWIWDQWAVLSILLVALTLILLLAPTLFSLWIFYFSKSKTDYHRSSQITKMVMVAGLVYLLLFLILK